MKRDSSKNMLELGQILAEGLVSLDESREGLTGAVNQCCE